jgi:hypothetical protein
MQNTSSVLMIRPLHFMYNAETAVNNSFQVKGDQQNLSAKAVAEFDELVAVLRQHDVEVMVIEDSPVPHTPDSIFPNNWISFHPGGVYCLYPMFAPNRRSERKPEVLDTVRKKFGYNHAIDFTFYEQKNMFLEGTGSMVLDRNEKIAYACLSPRTDPDVLEDFCERMEYNPIKFHAANQERLAIYHTNVMMCVADQFVVICLDSILDPIEQKIVSDTILLSNKEIIPISFDQMNHFAGNMLQLENRRKEKLLVMSTTAFKSLQDDQIKKLSSHNTIVHSSLSNIELNGGGSARCMIAEIHQ